MEDKLTGRTVMISSEHSNLEETIEKFRSDGWNVQVIYKAYSPEGYSKAAPSKTIEEKDMMIMQQRLTKTSHGN
jgi:hypothetical protein